MTVFEIVLFGLVCLCGFTMIVCRYVAPSISQREIEPWYLDYARSFFPVLLVVFVLRGFVAEPFRIPSGSMLPTLEVGDFILVNKFKYGIRLPITHHKVVNVSQPKRGDIVVFRWPVDDKTSYIKRLIGLPGDLVELKNGILYVNGVMVRSEAAGDYLPHGQVMPDAMYVQTIPTGGANEQMVEYSTLVNKYRRRSAGARQWKVPEGHYFMMGDNRDNSSDSRRWSFVPDENIIGKAFFVWFHYNPEPGGGVEFSRIATPIQAKEVE